MSRALDRGGEHLFAIRLEPADEKDYERLYATGGVCLHRDEPPDGEEAIGACQRLSDSLKEIGYINASGQGALPGSSDESFSYSLSGATTVLALKCSGARVTYGRMARSVQMWSCPYSW